MTETARIENVETLRESDKALLVAVDGEEVWIPKSAIHDDSEVYGMLPFGESGTLVIPRWLAEEKGLA